MKSDNRNKGDRAETAITVDFVRYAHHLKGLDLSEEAKIELLQALWVVACEFVALGFDVHPVQSGETSSGKDPKSSNKRTNIDQNMLSSLSHFIRENHTRRDGSAVKKSLSEKESIHGK